MWGYKSHTLKVPLMPKGGYKLNGNTAPTGLDVKGQWLEDFELS